MFQKRNGRWFLFVGILVCFFVAVMFSYWRENRTCMGVQILTEEQLRNYQENFSVDIGEGILFNDVPAAVDRERFTIYISQQISQNTIPKDLVGKLRWKDNQYQLYFAPDEAFADMQAAVQENHGFPLVITDGKGKCTNYKVIFTTLPVLKIDDYNQFIDEKKREVFEGRLCLWSAFDPDTGRYSVKESIVQKHVRGGATRGLGKKSWKLSLKEKSGDNQNLSLLGLGADDDWILNPMVIDDTKLREKLFQTVWNQVAENTSWNDKMSSGEYVEVILNKRYVGLYMLQRRIDGKYLNLGSEDILLKAKHSQSHTNVNDVYEVIKGQTDGADSFAPIIDFFYGRNHSIIDVDNFIDVNIFLQWASAVDNRSKNMFFILRKDEQNYCMTMLPWDTDMTWGLYWIDGYVYDFGKSMGTSAFRVEYDKVKLQYTDLEYRIAERWFELREDELSVDNVLFALDTLQQQLCVSGSLLRENACWGYFYEDGVDTIDNLRQFISEKQVQMDTYFLQY